jgi:hypothetical protein
MKNIMLTRKPIADSAPKTPAPSAWSFPPRGGPMPWTPKQIQEHQRTELAKVPDAPF